MLFESERSRAAPGVFVFDGGGPVHSCFAGRQHVMPTRNSPWFRSDAREFKTAPPASLAQCVRRTCGAMETCQTFPSIPAPADAPTFETEELRKLTTARKFGPACTNGRISPDEARYLTSTGNSHEL